MSQAMRAREEVLAKHPKAYQNADGKVWLACRGTNIITTKGEGAPYRLFLGNSWEDAKERLANNSSLILPSTSEVAAK